MNKRILFLSLLFLICSTALIPTACFPASTNKVTAPPAIGFSSTEDSIMTGDSTTLFWIVTDATSVEIDQGIGSVVPTVGSVLVSPASDTTYTLTASNSLGSVTQSVTITVTTPTPLMIPSLAKITLKPMGDIDQNILDGLKERLEKMFGCPVEIVPEYYNLDDAYIPRLGQYSAETLLYQLYKAGAARGQKVLGIVDGDLYVPGGNFVLGLGQLRGRIGLISVSGLRENRFSKLSSEALLLNRVTKEAVHELGHTLGLEHCPDTKCVMYFSVGVNDMDYKRAAYCSVCHLTLDLLH
jgi:archaemetzincin